MKLLSWMTILVLNAGALAVEPASTASNVPAPGLALPPLPGAARQPQRSPEYQAKSQSLQAALVAYQQALEKEAIWQALEAEAAQARARLREVDQKQREFMERNKAKFATELRALDQAHKELRALMQRTAPVATNGMGTVSGVPSDTP